MLLMEGDRCFFKPLTFYPREGIIVLFQALSYSAFIGPNIVEPLAERDECFFKPLTFEPRGVRRLLLQAISYDTSMNQLSMCPSRKEIGAFSSLCCDASINPTIVLPLANGG